MSVPVASPQADQRVHRGRRWLVAASLVSLVLVATTVWMMSAFVQSAREALRAEDRFQAVILVCDLVGDHVERTPGHAWPTSWNELERLPARDWSNFSWPRDRQRIESLVQVDFASTVEAVLRDRPETFEAIRPATGKAQFSAAGYYEMLQGRIRTVVATPEPSGK